jgi:hypothetical protein
MGHKTISELEGEHYTAIMYECRDPACRNCVANPFKLSASTARTMRWAG